MSYVHRAFLLLCAAAQCVGQHAPPSTKTTTDLTDLKNYREENYRCTLWTTVNNVKILLSTSVKYKGISYIYIM